jgi:hypothetical protein
MECLSWDFHCPSFSTSICIPRPLPISIIPLIIPRSIVSSLDSSTRSSAYFTVRIACLLLKYPDTWRRYLVRYWLYKVNRIGAKRHPSLNPLPVFTLLFSFCTVLVLTIWSTFKLLLKFLSRQWITVFFRICINSVRFTGKNAFYQSMNQVHISLSMCKIWYDIILRILIACLVSFPFQNPNWYSSSTSSVFLWITLLCILNIMFGTTWDEVDCVLDAAFCSIWLLA